MKKVNLFIKIKLLSILYIFPEDHNGEHFWHLYALVQGEIERKLIKSVKNRV